MWQFVAGLLVGGRVEIFERSDAVDPERLPAALDAARVTIFETVPSVLGVLLELEEQAAPSTVVWPAGLRWLIPTGEPLPPDFCRRWLELHPKVPLVNAYGPTECSDDVTHHTLRRPPTSEVLQIPIGRGVENCQLFVLDRRMEPVPLGGTGGLFVGGVGVGWGYLGEGLRTARVFVPDPLGEVGGGRLYFTGDRARFLPTGELEFLGRLDHQVKVRGFRIELPEIEAALIRHPGVAQAAVIVRPDAAGRDALAAFVVPTAGQRLEVEELRSALGVELPDYMIPTSWQELEALPLLTSGKVDRLALRRKAPPERVEGDHKAPRTQLEATVAKVWSDVLGLPEVSVEDNFFALGGHSLLATQVVSRLCRELSLDSLPLRLMFEKPTVRSLAAELPPSGGETALDVMERQSGLGPFPLAASQERLWFLHRLESNSTAYNSVEAARLHGPLKVEILEQALREIVRRHTSLRTVFVEGEEGVRQWILPEVSLTLPRLDLQRLDAGRREELVRALCAADGARPFDLARGPVLRVALLQLEEEESVLLVGVHHIAADAWSQGVFLHELEALYGAAIQGQPSPLPEPELQYVDFACWQRRWLAEGALETQLDYWRERLAGPLPVLELPTDQPRPAEQSFRGASVPWEVSRELKESLESLSKEHDTTLYMTFLAAFSVLLYRYSWQEDLLIGCPVANRNRVEIEGMIGFFVNTLVQRIDLSGEPTFAALLGRVREVTIESQAHQDVPFERLVEELAPERDLSRNPLFQVLFQLFPGSLVTAAEGALRLERVPFEEESVRFDLALSLAVGDETIVGRLRYSTDLFEPATAELMLQRLERLLLGVAEDANRPLLEYPFDENEPEQHQVAVTLPTEEDFDFD